MMTEKLADLVADMTGGCVVREGYRWLHKIGSHRNPAMPEQERDPKQLDPHVREVMLESWNGKNRWPLFLFGEAGSGKTCASLIMLDNARSNTHYNLSDWSDHLRMAKSGDLYEFGYIKSLKEVRKSWWLPQICVIDEIGERKESSDHMTESLKRAIDWRKNYPLILISNRHPSQLASIYGDPIVSRISEGTLLEFSGDRRVDRNEGT